MGRLALKFLSPALFALLAWGCGGDADPARAPQASSGAESPTDEPEGPDGPPPLPEPLEGTFSLPVRLPLAAIGELIDAALPRHEKQGYQRLTRKGRSPEIEARYEIWRDPVRVRFSKSTLDVEVPLRYAARFNARLKNPFGGKWLRVARDEPWGTKDRPLRVALRLRTRIEISKHWKLSLETKVKSPVHGAPPDGKICTGGSFKLCVAKSSIAPEVQKRMDAELLPIIRKAVADFDREATRVVSLQARVKRVFRELVQPRRADHGRWMSLEPRQAALELRAEGDAIVAEPALSARLSYHERKPAGKPPALQDREPLSRLPDKRLTLPEALTPPELQILLQAI